MSYTVGRGTEPAHAGPRQAGGEALARRRGAAVALPAGAHPGAQDRQGDDLLAGARRLHARQLDPDPPRPVRLREVRQARRRLQRRVAGHARSARSCGPPASTTSRCSAPATSAPRSPPRTSSPTTGSAWWPSSTSTAAGGDAHRAADGPPQLRAANGGRGAGHRRRRAGGAVGGGPELADELVDAGVKIIFNYSDALLQVPPEVTVHTSSPAVDLLYALYFYLT